MDDRSFFGSFMFNFFKPFITPKFDDNFNHQQYDRSDDKEEGASGISHRDSLLKQDKSKKQNINPYTGEGREDNSFLWHWHPFGHSQNEDFDTERNDEDSFFGNSFSHDFSGGFSDFNSIFSMMDELFERSRHFNFGEFGHHPNVFPDFPNVPSIDSSHPEEERKDKDLDDSSGKQIASLLKDSPSYQNKSLQSPLSSSSRFHSTSIVKIRRPDGTIEETRKYRDSDGREETEIITHEPGADGSSQPLEPFAEHSFSSIFKKFPFTIF